MSTAAAGSPSPVSVLMQPGWHSSGMDHWQTHWERRLRGHASRIEQANWANPDCEDWRRRLHLAITSAPAPAVLIAHSVGCIAAVETLLGMCDTLPTTNLKAAVLVAPADLEREGSNAVLACFRPIPLKALPLPALMIVSTNDPYCSLDRAQQLANAWRADLETEPDAGHLNQDSGFGPWQDGWDTVQSWLGHHRLCLPEDQPGTHA